MYLEKVKIKNFKCFRDFTLELNSGINIIVGNNEAGKTTILEAIHLALSGLLDGKYFMNQLTQYVFNLDAEKEYLRSLKMGQPFAPPNILIEVFIKGEDEEIGFLKGDGNSDRADKASISYSVEFDADYSEEYEELIKQGVSSIPIEYYKVSWKTSSRENITARRVPLKSAFIDSSSNRVQKSSDMYVSRIIRNDLSDRERVEISQAFRQLKEDFRENENIQAINDSISEKAKITQKSVSVSVDMSYRDAWEQSLLTFLDEIPLQQSGKGEQSIVKTHLALGHKKAKASDLILIEEPENHLSHVKLNELIKGISDKCGSKQIIITSHSSYVANKLGLESLIFLNKERTARLKNLTAPTQKFFKKLPGYETLRLLLCKKAVLVEGDSDELIFQKIYQVYNEGRLPIEDGIDVISVKLTFLRFLEIASLTGKSVAVITDNDGDYSNTIEKKYEKYKDVRFISIFSDSRNDLHTLEPQLVDANRDDLETLRKVLEIKEEKYGAAQEIVDYMIKNKTACALKIFDTTESLNYPDYIIDAVKWCSSEE